MEFVIARDPFLSSLNQLLTMPDAYETSKGMNNAARSYVRDTKAQASTAVDVKENLKAYVFVADMPGLKSSEITVQVENDNVLTIGGERKREEPAEDTKYIQLERSAGKFLRKFTLPSNADLSHISASSTDGILTVTVPKLPPPEPHKPKVIDVKIG
jgi:HSP20 family protein